MARFVALVALIATAEVATAEPAVTDAILSAAISDVMAFSALQMARFSGTPGLAQTFNNTYVFTATQTWHRFEVDGTVFVDTGDIGQQWLRDSSNQMMPYIPLAKTSVAVRSVFSGVLKRMTRFFVDDIYASAFNPTPKPNSEECPHTLECPECTCEHCSPACSKYSYQHNYEMDSICFVVGLAHKFWQVTNDTSAFDSVFHSALEQMVELFSVEQDHLNHSPYRFDKGEHVTPNSSAHVGLLWGMSRPSDDREYFNYNIPQNMLAVVALTKTAELAKTVFSDPALEKRALALRDSVDAAIQKHGVFLGNLTVPKMYAFEVDGFGNQLLMDDANMPNLLSIPFMGYPDTLGLYENTRSFVLRPLQKIGRLWSPGNPYYYEGQVAAGLGSGHQSHGLRPASHNRGAQCFEKCVWPLGLIMEARTAGDAKREKEILLLLLKTDDGQQYMHEGFDANNATKYNRDYFGWANAMFASWVMESSAFGGK
jgi:meiotically up-regulated gene 157 (Mug157) protein